MTGGGIVTINTEISLTASTIDRVGTTTFIWQKRNADGSYEEVQKKEYDADGTPVTPVQTRSGGTFEGIKDSNEPVTTSNGSAEYRCLIERTVTTTGNAGEPTTATTLPTANEAIATETIRIQSVSGTVYIQTPQPVAAAIYILSGRPVKQLDLPAGDSRIELPAGLYIIRAGNLHQKVIVR